MKLQRLNAAIDAAPKVYARFSFGAVPLEKSGLKAALRDHHQGQRTAETRLAVSADGFLVWEVTSD